MGQYYKLIALLFCIAAVVIRCLNVGNGLPYYSIDENDVVEAALSYVAGDIEPYWYKYGPLYAYILAGVFAALQSIGLLFSNWNTFFYSAFYDSETFYLIARIMHSLITLIICAAAFRFANKYYDKSTAWVALVLCSAPLLEMLTFFTVRIDTLQGLWVILALTFAAGFADTKHYKQNHILAAVFFALSVATKPIPAILILPALVYAHVIAEHKGKHLMLLGLFTATALLAHFMVHPYSLIHIDRYILEQFSVITDKNYQGGSMPGWRFSWMTDAFGIFFSVVLACTIAICLTQKDRVTRMLLIYAATFCGVYLIFDVRTYWYNAVLPILLLLMARGLVIGLGKLKHTQSHANAWATLFACALVIPALNNAIATPSNNKKAMQDAEVWIEENIPSHSVLFMAGRFATNLPRIASADRSQQGLWAEYFMYGREYNQPWQDRFFIAFITYMNSGQPAYFLSSIGYPYEQSPNYKGATLNGIEVNQILDENLDQLAISDGCDYIITGSASHFAGHWEQNKSVKLLAKFEDGINEVKIFKILTTK